MIRHLALLLVLLVLAAPAAAQEHRGTLASGDLSLRDGSYADAYTFEAVAGQRITVSLASDAFDTFLVVTSPSGRELSNDDFDGQRLSRLELLATEAGTWTAYATSYGAGSTGAYVLSIEKGAVGRLERIEGRLDPRDQQALKGEYYDTHYLEVDADGDVVFELHTYGFDSFLVVTSPSGQIWRNDDAGPTTISRVGPVPAQAGTWRVDVTSAGTGEVGAYDLNLIHLP